MTEPNGSDPERETPGAPLPSPTNSATEPTGAMSADATQAGTDPATATPLDPTTATADAGTLERRAFVRRMGSDAVRTAGTVFSFSRILTRTAAVAGQTVIGELERIQGSSPSGDAASPPVVGEPSSADPAFLPAGVAAAEPSPVASAEQLPAAAAEATPPARLPLRIDDEQRAILEAATSAVVAVNRAGHPPQLTTAAIHWDGAAIRFLTLGWSRRTTMLRTDPRIGLLIDEPGGQGFVTVTGQARIADGRDARDEAWPVLRAELGAEADEMAIETRWQELVAADMDRAVIVVEPDQVLPGRR